MHAEGKGSRRRWRMLAVGMTAQCASCVFLYGLAYLVPVLRADEGMSLTAAGTLVTCPTIGLMATLVLWGAAADRFGERVVMASGMLLAGGAIGLAVSRDGVVWMGTWLAVAGACSASVNAASGRVVLGWFGPEQRGVAMGVRQMAQPLGMVAGALVLPPIGSAHGFRTALLFPMVFCVLAGLAVAFFVADPPREAPAAGADRPASPYGTPVLFRIHAAGALLVIPQFVVVSYSADYLVQEHGWTATSAGRLLAVVQTAAAVSRLVVGAWSDRMGSRLIPMRRLSLANAAAVAALAVAALGQSWPAVVALLVASVATVCWNGVAFTSVAELAGSAWAGRALGIHNTGQNLAAAASPPVFAMVIGGPGYAAAYGICAVIPLAAAALTPVGAERGAGRNAERGKDRGADPGTERGADRPVRARVRPGSPHRADRPTESDPSQARGPAR
ncbi:MFS transporter [Yinghuangia soli]|uniref:MFS transporter n=1 Tax=Yinghuangia soli TaxID=2908204 RepID=A0AA41TYY7_9ACTN|nr:MFS transporter [Yinghuangia soli]MCF2528283.1 MFS transporter [Yinghuangia soli]